LDKVRSVISAGAKLILHVEKGLDLSLLRDVIKTQAFVLFKSSLFDYKSPFRALERKTRCRGLIHQTHPEIPKEHDSSFVGA
jgi:hypothetical protein